METSNFNWCLEIVTNDMIAKPPQAFRDLVAKSLSSTSTPVKDQFGFAFPSVALHVPMGVVVNEACIRSVLQYMLQGTSYVVEVTIYRRLDVRGAVTSTDCAISLYDVDWDHLMGPEGVTEEREWKEDLFFKNTSTSETGISDFQAKVRTVQHILGSLQPR